MSVRDNLKCVPILIESSSSKLLSIGTHFTPPLSSSTTNRLHAPKFNPPFRTYLVFFFMFQYCTYQLMIHAKCPCNIFFNGVSSQIVFKRLPQLFSFQQVTSVCRRLFFCNLFWYGKENGNILHVRDRWLGWLEAEGLINMDHFLVNVFQLFLFWYGPAPSIWYLIITSFAPPSGSLSHICYSFGKECHDATLTWNTRVSNVWNYHIQ